MERYGGRLDRDSASSFGRQEVGNSRALIDVLMGCKYANSRENAMGVEDRDLKKEGSMISFRISKGKGIPYLLISG